MSLWDSEKTAVCLAPTAMYKLMRETGKRKWRGLVRVFRPSCECPECAEQVRPYSVQTQGRLDQLYAQSQESAEVESLARQRRTNILSDREIARAAMTSNGEN